MTKNVLICGNDPLVEAILQHNIIEDKSINFIWYQKEVEFSDAVQDVLTSEVLAKNLGLTATNTPDWSSIDLLLIGDLDVAENANLEFQQKLRSEIHWTQVIMNQAMANNFAGKVCFLTEHCEEQVFSALHFSGLPVNAIFGLGTFPLSILAEKLISNILKIDVRQVHVSVLGTSANALPAWSRGLVAGTPLLSLIAQENSLFSQDELTAIEEQLNRCSKRSLLPAILNGLDRVFEALFTPFAQSIPLTHQVELGGEKIAISEPVLLSTQGVSTLPTVNLSEDEKQRFVGIKTDVLSEIQTLVRGQ
ncbi:lactate dehydrogenase [Ligilactobacillus pobuzihii]|uniref:lactate dehydrogenase n=1 Tax=Ligilactobacillus pobuzihii TaxID=449659 RepID=UPI0019D07BBF|nr:lactate dehydrogenase [Ligilactobacillus pobuzihii]MBN7275170.1 lactate dehydrogenase [Ligilactobacillus pobuzihii]